MARYGKCSGCGRKENCTFLADAKIALAGHGKLISSVRVNCKRAYEDDFHPGDRVIVKTSQDFPISVCFPSLFMSNKAWRYLQGQAGTLVSWSKNGRANILFDRDEEGCDYLSFGLESDVEFCRLQSLQHRDIVKIAEPKRSICEWCTIPTDENGNPERWPMKSDVRECGYSECQLKATQP